VTYLVDTDWVVDYLAGVPEARTLIATLLPDGIAVSIVTYVEVYEGMPVVAIRGARNGSSASSCVASTSLASAGPWPGAPP
jgi:hypothetical protein